MFSETADLYDVIYSAKDYAGEAAKIRSLIAKECPRARSILDVACGTAEHARMLSPDFQVDGIDLEPRFVEIARSKIPTGDFCVADMRSFETGKRYDIVQCLFSAIGYLLTEADIVAALSRFRQHLAPGGVIFVEPWLAPSAYKPGLVHMAVVDKPDLKICRMNTSSREGDISVLHFHYLIATGEGVRHTEEIHRLALVSPEKMGIVFRAAGLQCVFDPVGLFGRGLFIARARD